MDRLVAWVYVVALNKAQRRIGRRPMPYLDDLRREIAGIAEAVTAASVGAARADVARRIHPVLRRTALRADARLVASRGVRQATGVHWPSVARAASGFVAVMAVGWAFALVTGWDWLALAAMAPAAACGYWWANRYERRAGVAPHHTEEEMAQRFLSVLLVFGAATVVVGLVEREWSRVLIGVLSASAVAGARPGPRRGGPAY